MVGIQLTPRLNSHLRILCLGAIIVTTLFFWVLNSEVGDVEYPKPEAVPHGGQVVLTAESPSCPSCGYPDCGCVNMTLQPTPVVQPLSTPVFGGVGALPTGITFGGTTNDVTVVPDAVQPVPPVAVPIAPNVPVVPPLIVPTMKPNVPLPVYTLVP